jgi:hypothetical protein
VAATIAVVGDMISLGNRRMTTGTGNLGTYESAGVAVTPNKFMLGSISHLAIEPAGGYMFRYSASAGKILAYQSDDAVDPLDEVGTTDISAAVFTWQAVGY